MSPLSNISWNVANDYGLLSGPCLLSRLFDSCEKYLYMRLSSQPKPSFEASLVKKIKYNIDTVLRISFFPTAYILKNPYNLLKASQ